MITISLFVTFYTLHLRVFFHSFYLAFQKKKQKQIEHKKMGYIITNDLNTIFKNMESHLKFKTPDCSIFSEDGYEFLIHKGAVFWYLSI